LLCHSCTYCCVLHIPKSIFLHDLQRPNTCSFETTSRSILQCIELRLNRSFCILMRIVAVVGGEICEEHQQT
jgi:hypothetical protein